MVKDIDLSRSPEDKLPSEGQITVLDPDIAFEHCKNTVKKHDFYAYMIGQHFPKSRQKYFYTVQAFYLEILKSREVSRQASICKRRLLFWAEVLHDIEHSKQKQMKEPIGVCLQQLRQNTNVNMDLCNKLVSYQIFDLERTEMQTMNDLTIYAENTRSLCFYMFLHILGIDDKNAYSAASHLGRCYGIIDVFRKMKYYLIQHRHYIPSDLLLKHGLFFERIYNPRVEGLVVDEFYDIVLEIAAHAKKHLEISRSYKDKLPEHAHRALLFGVDADKFLTDLEEYNFDLFDDHFRKIFYLKMSYKILKASQKGEYQPTTE